jgi:hypothetical protein
VGHTKPSDLKDVQDLLDEIRQWEQIKEKSPNVFYFKSKPFLHFHDKDGKRWADVLDGDDWGKPLDLPFGATPKQKDTFLKVAMKRYRNLRQKS